MKYRYNVLLLCLSSFIFMMFACKDEVDVYEDFEVEVFENTKLKDALIKKGYSFDDNGQLICNSMVLETKELNLSNCELVSLQGLDLFTSLEILNVDNNKFIETFDFEYLPKTLKSISLKGNDNITFYKSLMDDTNTKIKRDKLDLLRLPASAKWNTNEIPAFAKYASDGTKIEIANESGDFSEYTFLREIPNETLRAKLMSLFPSIFDKTTGKINLNFEMTETADLIIDEPIESLEGVEYIIGREQFKGNVSLKGMAKKKYNMNYVSLSSNVTSFSIVDINTPNGVYLTNATSLRSVRVENNDSVPYIRLSNSFLSPNTEAINSLTNNISVINCNALIGLSISNENLGGMGKISLNNLPSLTELDLSSVNGIHTFVAYGLNSGIEQIKLPTEMKIVSDGYGTENGMLNICLAIENENLFQSFIDLCNQAAKVYDVKFFYEN